MSNPFYLTLGQAAKRSGVAKSTLSRAVEKGQISVAERVGNSFRIDPAELRRWTAQRSAEQESEQSATPYGPALEQQIEALKMLLAEKDQRLRDIEQDRDRWHEQAQRLAITAANKSPSRGFWGWLKGNTA